MTTKLEEARRRLREILPPDADAIDALILAHLEAREGKGRRYMSGDHVYREHIPGYEPSPEPAPVAEPMDTEEAGVMGMYLAFREATGITPTGDWWARLPRKNGWLAAFRFARDIGRAEQAARIAELEAELAETKLELEVERKSSVELADGLAGRTARANAELAEAKAELVSHREALDIQIEKLVKSKAELAEANAKLEAWEPVVRSAVSVLPGPNENWNGVVYQERWESFKAAREALSPEHRPAPEKGE